MPTTIRFTADHYRALPEDAPRMELLDGEYEMTPAPSPRHQAIVMNFSGLLWTFFGANPIGRVFGSPIDVYLGESDVVQPDLVVLLKDRYGRIGDRGITGAPDLVVEVLSPNTSVRDLTLKKEIYARAGIPEYWLADPKAATITVHRLQEKSEAPRIFRKGDAISSRLLPGFVARVDEVFA